MWPHRNAPLGAQEWRFLFGIEIEDARRIIFRNGAAGRAGAWLKECLVLSREVCARHQADVLEAIAENSL